MSDTATQLRDNVRSTAADLEILVAIASEDFDKSDGDTAAAIFEDHGREITPDTEWAETAREILDEWPLGFVEHGKRTPGGEWETTHVVVVFGTGGPHIELDTSERAVMGYWGSDRDRAPVSGAVVEYFEGLTNCRP